MSRWVVTVWVFSLVFGKSFILESMVKRKELRLKKHWVVGSGGITCTTCVCFPPAAQRKQRAQWEADCYAEDSDHWEREAEQRDWKPTQIRAGGQKQGSHASLAPGAALLPPAPAGRHTQREHTPHRADQGLQGAHTTGMSASSELIQTDW